MAGWKSVQDRVELRNGCGIPCVGFGTWKMPQGTAGFSAARGRFRPAPPSQA